MVKGMTLDMIDVIWLSKKKAFIDLQPDLT